MYMKIEEILKKYDTHIAPEIAINKFIVDMVNEVENLKLEIKRLEKIIDCLAR